MNTDVMDDFVTEGPRSNTLIVLALVVLAAMTFSYLAAYALPEVLLDAQMIAPWPASADPRPHWLALIFVGVLGTFLAGTTLVRLASARQLHQIDRTSDE